MDLSDYIQYSHEDHFWNKNQIKKGLTKCFLFKTCYSLEIPDLSQYSLNKDSKLTEYQKIMHSKKNRSGIDLKEKIT